MTPRRPDCVIVGYNDWDFRKFIKALEPSRPYSSAYMNILKNTVELDGERLLYNEALGHLMTKATRSPHRYNAFEVASLGACYLASFLRRRGYGVELVNFFTYDRQRLAAILEDRPRAVAITTTFYFMPEPVQEIVAFVREHSPETTIVVGGPYIYNICRDSDPRLQDMLFANLGADVYINDSQGELTLSRVVAALLQRNMTVLETVPNLILREGRTFRRTGREPENNNLDAESELWESFEPSLVTPVTYLRTARSCAFACAFCSYPDMAGPLSLKSVETVEAELKALRMMGGRFVVFVDDTFNVPLPRFKKLLRMMIANEFKFRWVSFLRCSNLDSEALELIEKSGCYGVVLGIESGDQTVLDKMNKSAQLARYEWGMQELHRRGIATSASFIIGFPGETPQTVQNTIDFIERTAPTFYVAEQYFHSKSTPVGRNADQYELRGGGYTWQHSTMNWSESAAFVSHVYRKVKNSRILPLYGLGMWGIPYLETKGFAMERVKTVTELLQPLLIEAMDDGGQKASAGKDSTIVNWLRAEFGPATVCG
jgi:radical SAM PhpK family P-methyltransferase